MLRKIFGLALAMAVTTAAAHADHHLVSKYTAKLDSAKTVFEDALKAPGKEIPKQLLQNCKAIAIFPGIAKASFVFGARYGEGVLFARDDNGKWSAPSYFTVTGGSAGLQAGIQSMDVVLLIMNEKGLKALLKQKMTLGGELAVVAGPAGLTGEGDVDLAMHAMILSYSRSRGLWAGVALNGARMAASPRMNNAYYGKPVSVDDIIMQRTVEAPKDAWPLIKSIEAATAK